MNLTNTKIVLKRRPNPEVSEDLFDKITDTVRAVSYTHLTLPTTD